MNRWVEFIQTGLKSKAFEFTFSSHGDMAYRQGKIWIRKTQEPLQKSHILQVLTETQKQKLQEEQSLKALLVFENLGKFRWTYQENELGQWFCTMKRISSHWLDASHLQLPKMTEEICKKHQGIFVIVGPKSSGKTSTMSAILKGLQQHRSSFALYGSEMNELPVRSDYGLLQWSSLSNFHPLSAHDVLLLDEPSMSPDQLASYAEAGRMVVVTACASSLEKYFQSFLNSSNCKRFLDQFQGALGQRLLHHQNDWVPAFESWVGTDAVKQALFEQDWKKMRRLGSDSVDAMGMRTFNQSLLQLVLKRKIEFKQGFEESPDPEELDQLLNKIGI